MKAQNSTFSAQKTRTAPQSSTLAFNFHKSHCKRTPYVLWYRLTPRTLAAPYNFKPASAIQQPITHAASTAGSLRRSHFEEMRYRLSSNHDPRPFSSSTCSA